MDDNPIHLKVWRMPPNHKKVVKKELRKLLEDTIITPLNSASSSTIVKDRTEDGTPRVWVSPRQLNRVINMGRWPLAKI